MKKMMIIVMSVLAMSLGLSACQQADAGQSGDNGVMGGQGIQAGNVQAEGNLTLQGNGSFPESLTGSAEYQAFAEWQAFCAVYDPDNEILLSIPDEQLEAVGDAYAAYGCYTKEMEAEVDRICEKYGLSKLGGERIVESYSELCSLAGLGEFCTDTENVKHNVLSGYIYADGTFLLESIVTVAGAEMTEADYQFIRVVKGSFSTAYLDFGNLAEYSVREYTTVGGDKVFLACGVDVNTYIIVEKEQSFVVVNVLGELSRLSDVNDERLSMLADAFDFSVIP